MSDPSTNCQYCGYPLRSTAKYCDACGQPVIRAREEAASSVPGPTTVMPKGYEDITTPPNLAIPTEQPNDPAPTPITPLEPPRHDDIPDYPVVKPAPPLKKSSTGLIIGLILGGGLLCLLTMTVIGYFVVRSISKNLKPTLESLVVPEAVSLPTMVEATFEPIPLDATGLPPAGGVAEVTLEPIDGASTPEKPSILTGSFEDQMAGDAYIVDDFSSDILDWGYESDDISVHQIEDGAYTINVLQPSYIAWSEVPVDWSPIYTEFDVWVPTGNDGGSYGVMCHYQSDNDYYYIEIDPSEDAYTIGYYLNGEYISLTDEEWPYTHALNVGISVNRVYVACELNRITLFLNDQFIDQVALTEPASPGAMEIFASTWDDMPAGGYKVFFDNFTAWKPAE